MYYTFVYVILNSAFKKTDTVISELHGCQILTPDKVKIDGVFQFDDVMSLS